MHNARIGTALRIEHAGLAVMVLVAARVGDHLLDARLAEDESCSVLRHEDLRPVGKDVFRAYVHSALVLAALANAGRHPGVLVERPGGHYVFPLVL